MYKTFLVIGILAWMTGCMAGQDYQRAVGSLLKKDFVTTGKDYQKVLDSWLGYDINALVRRWGYPSNTLDTLLSLIHISEPTRPY